MRDRLLAFLVIGVLGIGVFVFFFFQTQPIPLPKSKTSETETLTAPVITFVDPIKGPNTAKITIVEYGDFECAACKDASSTIHQILQQFPADVRFVWKDVPNDSAHPNATSSAVAAQCAHQQGKFWEYSEKLFESSTALSSDLYPKIAETLELNTKTFSSCLNSQQTLPRVKKSYEEGMSLGLVATPTIFVNEQVFVGAPTLEELTQRIKTILTPSS